MAQSIIDIGLLIARSLSFHLNTRFQIEKYKNDSRQESLRAAGEHMNKRSMRELIRKDLWRVLLASAVTTGISLTARAATTEAPADQGAQLEEIVITAQKRAEDLQVVPISVQVISGQQLTEENYNSLGDLTRIVPGVHLLTGGFSDSISIRGLSSGDNPGFDQSVATFVDDIYHGRARTSTETFLDLDRIEVLKGPQSTFFGNNAIAGALNVVTTKPGGTSEGYARALYGMHGQYALESAATLPANDVLSFRVAGTINGIGGWIKNVDTGKDAPDTANGGARLTTVFRPSSDFDATLKIEGSRNKTLGTGYGEPYQWVNCPPPKPFTPTYGGSCSTALSTGAPIGLDNNYNAGLPGQETYLSTFESVLTLNYRKWGQVFTSVSGFSSYDSNQNIDENLLGPVTITNDNSEKYHQFSQELRVASSAGGPLEYLAGLYFQADGLTSDAEANAPVLNFLGTSVPSIAPYLPLGLDEHFSQPEQIYSVFGSLRWNATDWLKFNAGLRGSWVKKSFDGDLVYGTGTELYGGLVPLPPALASFPSFLYGPPGSTSLSQPSNAWMPSAGVQFQLTPDAMAYFSYSKGFLAGGFNAISVVGVPSNVEFGPEHVNDYEVGLKSKWFDNRLLFDINLFRSNYTGLQVSTSTYQASTNTYLNGIRNAASQVSEGVELETQFVATNNFRLSANVSYLEAYYVNFPNAGQTTLQAFCAGNYVLPYCSIFPNPVPQFGSVDGQTTQNAPRWSGSVSAIGSVPLPGGYKFTGVLSPYFTSSYNRDPQLVALGFISGTPAYVRLDARLSLETPQGHWAFDLIGKNLTNKIIVISTPGLYNATKEEPVNVAVQLRYKW